MLSSKFQFNQIPCFEDDHGLGDLFRVLLDFRPACRRQNQNRELPAGEILLIPKVLVGRDEDGKGIFGGGQQMTVAQIRPAHFVSGGNFMAGQVSAQRNRCAVVKQDFHAPSRDGETLLRMFQYGPGLLARDSGKPLQKIIHCCPILQIFKQCSHGYACTPEKPRATDFSGDTFHRTALAPIQHVQTIPSNGLNGKG